MSDVISDMRPLCVDLDGTLIHTDMLHESTLVLVRQSPAAMFALPMWLSRGKAWLKQMLSTRVDMNVAALPYNDELLGWLKSQREQGRRLVLCTASDARYAHAISEHLGIFDEVIASDGAVNLAGSNKAEALCRRFGERGFDYVGNSSADLSVWKKAGAAVVVNGSAGLVDRARACCEVSHVLPRRRKTLGVWRRVFRVHQWMKNVLLGVPLLASHQIGNLDAWWTLLLAFVSFSLCASSVYITNDLLDLESDRLHPRKRARPFASGAVPVWQGVVLAPILLVLSFGLGWFAGRAFLAWLLVYFVLTTAYSLWLKRVALVDCLALAALYTLRVVAGSAAVTLQFSFWLLAFSVFLFLSLAFVKRYAELLVQAGRGKDGAHGRGYVTADAPLIEVLGVASGFASVMVLALYLNSEAVLRLYATPQLMWGAVPVMLFWISWVWMCAHRGEMHDDPMVFAVKDRASQFAGVIFVGVLILGTMSWA